MDNIRLFLWVGLVAVLWLNYMAYVRDHPPPQSQTAVSTRQTPPASRNTEAPPKTPGETAETPLAGAAHGQIPSATAAVGPPAMPIHVRTDVYDLVIDPHGGNIVRVDLPEYPVHKDQPDVPVRMLDYRADDRWLIQTGLTRQGDTAEPDQTATYRASSNSFTMAPGEDKLVVKLDWVNPGGVDASKIYTFTRGSYRVDVDIQLHNHGAQAWQVASYAQMLRMHQSVKRHIGDIESYSFKGPVLYNGDHYKKLDFDDLKKTPIAETVQDGWLAGIEHHFVAAVIPPDDQAVQFHASAQDDNWTIRAVTPVTTVAPGQSHDFPITLFIGPKLQKQLATTADDLQRTVDYGVLSVLAQPLFLILSKVERVTGNWGWAIIIVTILIKLAFYKLTEISGRSMAKMRRLQPRIKALQERYKEDRQAQSQAMMELYKKEKVNPAAGCLPMIIQMPFFFAWYWVLIESVEIRQQPFMLWIGDLSVRDPYYILPVLMGVAYFVQSRLAPTPTTDPMQARIMQIVPLAFTVFFAFFPSGLVLYYLTNTVLGILQQWRINQVVA
ncbi:MAG TPA: membrane protein insertase YidC, partial [Gammaproteobacteria bacterium]|nr:membrane protein insertase YidC [Gammaproteobacteria bacterium]